MQDTEQDPHPPHLKFGWATCPTPASAMPGDEWTCPDCGRSFFALDTSTPDMATIEWQMEPPCRVCLRRDCQGGCI